MATLPTNPTPPQPPASQQPPAPAPSANPNEMTPQQIRDLAAGPQPVQQPPAAQPVAPPQVPGLPPIERQADGSLSMRMPTGQVYKGRNEWELMAALATAQTNASSRITELGNDNQRLRQGIAAVSGQPVTGADGQPVQAASQFDRAIFMELQAQDPILAMNYLDQHRFGLAKIDDVVPYYTRTFQAGDRFAMAETVNNFRLMAPDFPGTQQAVDAVMDFVKRNNIPFNAENLKMVHDGMVMAHAKDPSRGYAPMQLQPNANAQPTVITPPPPGSPILNYDPNPAGNYGFGPNGFGTQEVAPAPTAPPVQGQPTAPTMPMPGYPTIPQVSTPSAPLPMPTVSPTQPPTAAASEGQVNNMSTDQLRQFIEAGLQR